MVGKHSYKPRSIARTLSVGLITTFVLVAGLSLVVNYLLSSRKAQTELEIIVMIGALLVTTGVLLRQFLKKPLARFIKMVDAYAAGDADAFKQGSPYSEFRPLVDVLDQMGEKLASQMRETRTRYRDLVENASCIIFQMDTQGKITFFNRYAQEFFGYSEAEILGRSIVGTITPATESTGRDLKIMMQDTGRSSRKIYGQ